MSFRKRMFAWILKKGEGVNLRLYKPYKQDLFQSIDGHVVEVGPGTGINFNYLPPGTAWTGIEPNEAFHDFLMKQASDHGIKARLVKGDAEHIPLPDNSADVVLCTLVLCSVANPVRAVSEIKRVLKPGGKLIFIEHVAAKQKSLLRRFQNFSNPCNRFMADGCNCNRETWTVLEGAGFSRLDLKHFRLKGAMLLHAPHIRGVATK